jgi:hypothetical protein
VWLRGGVLAMCKALVSIPSTAEKKVEEAKQLSSDNEPTRGPLLVKYGIPVQHCQSLHVELWHPVV